MFCGSVVSAVWVFLGTTTTTKQLLQIPPWQRRLGRRKTARLCPISTETRWKVHSSTIIPSNSAAAAAVTESRTSVRCLRLSTMTDATRITTITDVTHRRRFGLLLLRGLHFHFLITFSTVFLRFQSRQLLQHIIKMFVSFVHFSPLKSRYWLQRY